MNEITDEQREAWAALTDYYPSAAQKVAPLLPSDLTDPQPVLPTEPGTTIYGGTDQPRTLFRQFGLSAHRPWVDAWSQRYTDEEARELMGEWDVTPPVPTRTQITGEEAIEALGRRWLHPDLVNSIVALVNGTDRD